MQPSHTCNLADISEQGINTWTTKAVRGKDGKFLAAPVANAWASFSNSLAINASSKPAVETCVIRTRKAKEKWLETQNVKSAHCGDGYKTTQPNANRISQYQLWLYHLNKTNSTKKSQLLFLSSNSTTMSWEHDIQNRYINQSHTKTLKKFHLKRSDHS